eukprot:jgi/Bigna1/80413/fgenesh1_pg.70_\
MYSACKKDGTPMYKLARQGTSSSSSSSSSSSKTVQREARKVTLYELKRIDAEKKKLPQFRIELECSKGLYVRVLVNDIGIKCGTLAHMTELTRAKQGKFGLEHCLPAEHITASVMPQQSHVTSFGHAIPWKGEEKEERPPAGEVEMLMVQKQEEEIEEVEKKGKGAIKRLTGLPRNYFEYKVGDEVEGTVQGVTRFGAFVDVGAERDALLHESQMGSRPPRLEAGTKVKVVIISIDERHGKIGLTLPGARKEQQEKEEEEKAVKERTICFSKLPSGSGARAAKEQKHLSVDGEELPIIATTEDHLTSFENLRRSAIQMSIATPLQRSSSRKRRGGGGGFRGGRGRGGGRHKRRREGGKNW